MPSRAREEVDGRGWRRTGHGGIRGEVDDGPAPAEWPLKDELWL